MDTLQLDKKNALKAYNEADDSGKQLLVNLYGKDVFIPQKVTDRIKTFMDVCAEAGKNISKYTVHDSETNRDKAMIYLERLELIAKVFNGGWVADMANTNQYKYYPWFKIVPDSSRPSGFALAYGGCVYDLTFSDLSARPYFKDSDTAIYVGKQFLAEFEAWAQYDNLSRNSL